MQEDSSIPFYRSMLRGISKETLSAGRVWFRKQKQGKPGIPRLLLCLSIVLFFVLKQSFEAEALEECDVWPMGKVLCPKAMEIKHREDVPKDDADDSGLWHYKQAKQQVPEQVITNVLVADESGEAHPPLSAIVLYKPEDKTGEDSTGGQGTNKNTKQKDEWKLSKNGVLRMYVGKAQTELMNIWLASNEGAGPPVLLFDWAFTKVKETYTVEMVGKKGEQPSTIGKSEDKNSVVEYWHVLILPDKEDGLENAKDNLNASCLRISAILRGHSEHAVRNTAVYWRYGEELSDIYIEAVTRSGKGTERRAGPIVKGLLPDAAVQNPGDLLKKMKNIYEDNYGDKLILKGVPVKERNEGLELMMAWWIMHISTRTVKPFYLLENQYCVHPPNLKVEKDYPGTLRVTAIVGLPPIGLNKVTMDSAVYENAKKRLVRVKHISQGTIRWELSGGNKKRASKKRLPIIGIFWRHRSNLAAQASAFSPSPAYRLDIIKGTIADVVSFTKGSAYEGKYGNFLYDKVIKPLFDSDWEGIAQEFFKVEGDQTPNAILTGTIAISKIQPDVVKQFCVWMALARQLIPYVIESTVPEVNGSVAGASAAPRSSDRDDEVTVEERIALGLCPPSGFKQSVGTSSQTQQEGQAATPHVSPPVKEFRPTPESVHAMFCKAQEAGNKREFEFFIRNPQ